MNRTGHVRIVIATLLLFTAFTGVTLADVIIYEPFLSGSDPAAGEYTPDIPLRSFDGTPPAPTVQGFTGNWGGNTGVIFTRSGALAGGAPDAMGGHVQFNYGGGLADRQVNRPVDTSYVGSVSGETFYLSGLMSFDADLADNRTAYTKVIGLGSYTTGIRWGFEGNGSNTDAVVQYRKSATNTPVAVVQSDIDPGTYRYVARVDQNYDGGYDMLQVWLADPAADPSSVLMNTPNFVDNTNYTWNDPGVPIDNVFVHSNQVGPVIGYDEIRMGTNPSDALPGSATLMAEHFEGRVDSVPGGWVAYGGNNQIGNDGNGEFQIKKTSSDTTSIAYYNDPAEISRGAWRDTTITSQTRFSGGDANDNGLVFRATEITSNSGTGDFYMTRVQNTDNLQLFRFNDGSATLLDQQAISGFNPTAGDNHYKISTENVFDASGNEGVQITIGMYADAALTNQIGSDMVYTDYGSGAILSPGGAGYRMYHNGGQGTRAVFDDLFVTSDKPLLDWAEDLTIPAGIYPNYITGTEPGVDFTQLDVDGSLTIDPSAEILLDFADGVTFDEGDILWFIDNDGTDAITGEFANLLDGESYFFEGDTLYGTVSYSADFTTGLMTGGNDVALMFTAPVIPEPSTWILGLMAAMGLVWHRRRRRIS